jgi:hypothetical protein
MPQYDETFFEFILFGIVFPFLVIIIPLCGIWYFGAKYTCEAKAEAQNLEWDFGVAKGCMVKTENGWMDYDRLIYKKEVK